MEKRNRSGRKGLVALGVVIPTAAFFFMNRQLTPTVAWGTDAAAALQAGQTDGKPVLLVFTGPGCPFCWRMERAVLPSAPVERELGRFIPVRVDTAADRASVQRFGIEGIPALVVVSPDGTIAARATGYHGVDEFTRFLRRVPASPAAPSGS
ncbi:MAG: thioredoxin family protein [Phycisphaerales bacterium]|nr:thioredoxin family protein [Phycisphaerales bacterium]